MAHDISYNTQPTNTHSAWAITIGWLFIVAHCFTTLCHTVCGTQHPVTLRREAVIADDAALQSVYCQAQRSPFCACPVGGHVMHGHCRSARPVRVSDHFASRRRPFGKRHTGVRGQEIQYVVCMVTLSMRCGHILGRGQNVIEAMPCSRLPWRAHVLVHKQDKCADVLHH